MLRAILTSAAIAAAVAVAPCAVASDGHARVIEAWAEPTPFDKAKPVRISPLTPEQARDPVFRQLAGELYDQLTEQGFKVVRPSEATDDLITLEYQTYNTNVRASGESSVNDPSYRMAIVTGWDIRDPAHPKLRWQTAVDSYGVSMNSAKVVPALLKSAAPSFGLAKTSLGLNKALWCADGVPQTGHKISPLCDPSTELDQQNQAGLLLGLTSFMPSAPGGMGGSGR